MRRTAVGEAGGIAVVVELQHIGDQRHVLDRAAVDADGIERRRLRQHAGARNDAEGRLEAVDAAEGGRADHRALGLRAERQRHHVGSDRRRRAGRRAAGRVLEVARVAGAARNVGGKLRGDGLAEDDGTGGAQRRDAGGVLVGLAALEERRAVLGRHVGRVDDVLDADGYAVQRADALAGRRASSAALACSSARSRSRNAQACTCGSSAAMRSRQAPTSASEVISPRAMLAAASAAVREWRSAVVKGSLAQLP